MLTGVAAKLTPEEHAREPRSLGIVAYFAGYTQGAYGRPSTQTFPRRLTRAEERYWREGFTEGRTERVCQSWHGFIPHADIGDHPPTVCPDQFPPMTWKAPSDRAP